MISASRPTLLTLKVTSRDDATSPDAVMSRNRSRCSPLLRENVLRAAMNPHRAAHGPAAPLLTQGTRFVSSTQSSSSSSATSTLPSGNGYCAVKAPPETTAIPGSNGFLPSVVTSKNGRSGCCCGFRSCPVNLRTARERLP